MLSQLIMSELSTETFITLKLLQSSQNKKVFVFFLMHSMFK